jgi:hypothetical protein
VLGYQVSSNWLFVGMSGKSQVPSTFLWKRYTKIEKKSSQKRICVDILSLKYTIFKFASQFPEATQLIRKTDIVTKS